MKGPYFQTLGAGAPDGGGPSLFLFFDHTRYLLNCGEGTQRFCGQHGIKLSRLSCIFLTSLEWRCIGGLPGLISTLADTSATDANTSVEESLPGIVIVGPKNTRHVIAAMRPFVQRSAFKVEIYELGDDEDDFVNTFNDGTLEITAFTLKNVVPFAKVDVSQSAAKRPCPDRIIENLAIDQLSPGHVLLSMFRNDDAPKDVSELSCPTDGCKREAKTTNRMSDMKKLQAPPIVGHQTLAYIIKGPSRPGKFDALAAKALGVPHGPLNGLLARGESITLPIDGKIVHPHQCVGPPIPGPLAILLDIPTVAHLTALIEDHRIASFAQPYCTVFWIVNSAVKESEIFLKIINNEPHGSFQFPAQVFHRVVLNTLYHTPAFPASIELCHKLSSLDSLVYRLPYDGRFENTDDSLVKQLERYAWTAIASEAIVECGPSSVIPCSKELLPHDVDSKIDNPMFAFLGSGAARPGDQRNVSATLVAFGMSALFDCGEGTVGQLLRTFGPIACSKFLVQRLKTILISHLHADHHAGLLGVLMERHRLDMEDCQYNSPVQIVAPLRYRLWLEEYYEALPPGHMPPYEFFPIEDLLENPRPLDYFNITPVPVEHCTSAYGFVLECSYRYDFRRIIIVYSGDTRPCQRLIEAGRGATVLIHECTLPDSMYDEAVAKRHCTASEAIQVACQMQAEYLFLTHFSQRFAKTVPRFQVPENSKDSLKVAMAFDLMCLNLSEMHKVCSLTDNLYDLLPEEESSQ